jgi:ribosomal protein S18 acetylase RimI-like enzyme
VRLLGTVISKPGSAWTYGYVIWLCARPMWQRAGVATKLVDKLVERMIEKAGIRIIMADTDPENVRAVRFFEKMGFDDRKPHVYLSSNLEHNPRYRELLEASRAEEEEAPRKRRKKAGARRSVSKKKKISV